MLAERQRYPNLASRVLALCLRRLDADWRARWEHPVLAVESFVDESLHPGTCYRACGFEALGLTGGYGRASRDFYCEHGKPKQLYLRELRPDAAAILRRGRLPAELVGHEQSLAGPCPFRAGQLRGLRERFLALADSRKRGHGMRHRQAAVLACAAAATLLGAGGYAAFEDICGKFTQRQLAALGCWQILAVKRERIELPASRAKPQQDTEEPELGYYVTSLGRRDTSDQALLDAVRGHWSAIENGVHHTRDVTFGEDRSRIAQPTAARVMATLRNLAIGIFNIEQERPATTASSLPSWQRRLTASEAIRFILQPN